MLLTSAIGTPPCIEALLQGSCLLQVQLWQISWDASPAWAPNVNAYRLLECVLWVLFSIFSILPHIFTLLAACTALQALCARVLQERNEELSALREALKRVEAARQQVSECSLALASHFSNSSTILEYVQPELGGENMSTWSAEHHDNA